jgi:hypothetical protein
MYHGHLGFQTPGRAAKVRKSAARAVMIAAVLLNLSSVESENELHDSENREHFAILASAERLVDTPSRAARWLNGSNPDRSQSRGRVRTWGWGERMLARARMRVRAQSRQSTGTPRGIFESSTSSSATPCLGDAPRPFVLKAAWSRHE